jgi:isopropylmalate/homocitrate/citramalate synthase
MGDAMRLTSKIIPLDQKEIDYNVIENFDVERPWDTFGVASPPVMKYISRKVREVLPPQMGLITHCHNTFGMATANTLACVEGGTNEADVVINGYGDEAGNASLEEVVVSLEALYGIDTGIKLEMLNKYSRMAIEKGKIPIQPHKAIVGENAFLRPMYIWAGIDMAKESWMLHEPLSAKLVGTKSTVVFGPEGSLDDAPIETKLRELGIPFTATDIVRVRSTVERLLEEAHTVKVRRKYLSESEFEDILRKVVKAKR